MCLPYGAAFAIVNDVSKQMGKIAVRFYKDDFETVEQAERRIEWLRDASPESLAESIKEQLEGI